jgi:hypothetical protein
MINTLIGIVIISILLYLLGIIPNLWSNNIINPTSSGDIIIRGFVNLFILIVMCVILLILYTIGSAFSLLL